MISRYTVYVIQGDDARSGYIQNRDGRFQGLVNVYHDDCFHATMISTNESQFETAEQAIEAMDDLIKQIKEFK